MTTIVLVDDVKIWHQEVARVLATSPHCQLVGAASNGVEALLQCHTCQPNIVLLDIGIPGTSGLELARKIPELSPQSRIIFFSTYTSRDIVTAALEAGGMGFVAKQDCRELGAAISTVRAGEKYLSRSVRNGNVACVVRS